ncbi:MAG: 30S ribosomal protein S12 methylthiotransferase RimO [Planctomycetes bacterium]|nr:30S ribosomal protein S12 methylthiotransferase RimO [Planctomycetota bacterium]
MDSPRVSFVSLGCAKNLVDSEVLLGRLAQDGFALCSRYEDSDVVVVNTCGFLKASERESMQTIDKMVELKRRGKLKAVVVAGCLPQRYGPDFEKRLRDVDAVLGISHREKIAEVCRTVVDRVRRRPVNLVSSDLPAVEIDRDRFRLTPRHTAYVRLSEGCNHTCAFCVIPQIRGKFRSKPREAIVAEARELARDGCREINLIAQDTTNYGLDLYGKLCLDELLEKLSDVEGIEWIRLLYCYPTFVTDRLIEAVARLPKVVKYVDIPIQHTRERVLRLMRRGVTEERQKELIAKLRAGIPGVVLRTTVIVGFPGETREDFEGMLEDLEGLKFERLGAFTFSRERGTPADAMKGRVPQREKVRRMDAVMRLQQRIAFARNRAWIGREVPVLVERRLGPKSWEGRTSGDAPEIDPIIVLSGNSVQEGAIARARVTGFRQYDLLGEVGVR